MKMEKKIFQISPLRIVKNIGTQHIELLFLTRDNKQHNFWIKRLLCLLASQVTGHKESVYFCRRCLFHYSSQAILANDMEYCIKKKQAANEMPKEDTVLVLTTINAK